MRSYGIGLGLVAIFAALFAVQILAGQDARLAEKLKEHRATLAKEVEKKAAYVASQL